MSLVSTCSGTDERKIGNISQIWWFFSVKIGKAPSYDVESNNKDNVVYAVCFLAMSSIGVVPDQHFLAVATWIGLYPFLGLVTITNFC